MYPTDPDIYLNNRASFGLASTDSSWSWWTGPNQLQQVWVGDTPEVMQVALFAGHKMMVYTDHVDDYSLDYLEHTRCGFTSMEDAKSAAPKFARDVLEGLCNLIQDV